AEQQGRKVPALMIYRDAWSDQRALQGATRFANARRVLLADFFVSEEQLKLDMRLADIHLDDTPPEPTPAAEGEAAEGEDEEDEKIAGRLETVASYSAETTADSLGEKLFEGLQAMAAASGQT